jgi:hypothetical protein
VLLEVPAPWSPVCATAGNVNSATSKPRLNTAARAEFRYLMDLSFVSQQANQSAPSPLASLLLWSSSFL